VNSLRSRAAILIAWTLLAPATAAGQASRELPVDQVKQILAQTQDSWLAFRVYDGKQLVYFTHLTTYHCALLEIRYSLNGTGLDRRFPVPKCNPLLPFNVGAEDQLYIETAAEDAKSIAVQLLYDDNSASDIYVYTPCPGAGDATCALLAETRPGEKSQSVDPDQHQEPGQRSAPGPALAPQQ
jgi:hypothetical protein